MEEQLKKKKSFRVHFVIGAVIGIIVIFCVGYLIFHNYRLFKDRVLLSTDLKTFISADYRAGYKAGHTNGHSTQVEVGDNYLPPSTKKGENAYIQGYLEGYLKACHEDNFDCSEMENEIRKTNN